MNPFVVISIAAIIAIFLEKRYPRKKLPHQEGWIFRAIIFNAVQFAVVIIGTHTWEIWLRRNGALIHLPWSPFVNGLCAYCMNAIIFYWWHYLRHINNAIWRPVHALHHSPKRIEVLTSFYKAPIEIVINSLIITILTGPILGLDIETNAWLTTLSALAEFFYHINVRVPRWIGYFIQTASMHDAHHMEDRQYTWNYGDIPLLGDIPNGTFWNPTDEEAEKIRTGFTKNRELLVIPMLLGQNVITERPKKLPPNLFKCMLISLLFLLGAWNMLGLIFDSPTMKGMAFVSGSSPLPFVFSAYNGIETFSTKYDLDITFKNGSSAQLALDHKLYSKMQGPYNRRNVLGAAFSHGPFFKDPKLIQMRDQIYDWSFCQGNLAREFGITEPLHKVVINVRSKTIGNEDKLWVLNVACQ